jgi:hypothetical protein
MTAQISDDVVYQDTRYDLAGIGGWGLFDPGEHGLHVGMISTACWRGFICEYAVEEGHLFLTSLQIGAAEPPDELFGARVRMGDRAPTYSPIRVPQTFTGGLLLGLGFIHELYVHMGYHPAWKYQTVLELTFDEGRLEIAKDRSELMAQRRAAQGSLSPTDPRDIDAWVEMTFDHSYPPML